VVAVDIETQPEAPIVRDVVIFGRENNPGWEGERVDRRGDVATRKPERGAEMGGREKECEVIIDGKYRHVGVKRSSATKPKPPERNHSSGPPGTSQNLWTTDRITNQLKMENASVVNSRPSESNYRPSGATSGSQERGTMRILGEERKERYQPDWSASVTPSNNSRSIADYSKIVI